MTSRIPVGLVVAFGCCLRMAEAAGEAPSRPDAADVAKQRRGVADHPPDHSGQTLTGKASYYSHRLSGKVMADGSRMNPQSNAAASKTLPLGTIAKVTNLRNGKSEVVEIKDRGPYVKGRIVDLSPSTARKLGMVTKGTVPVEVAPIAVPRHDTVQKEVPAPKSGRNR